MKSKFLWLFLASALLQACIGEDVLNDFVAPIDDSRIEFVGLPANDTPVQLSVDDTISFAAVFIDQNGVAQDASIDWTSTDQNVAIVDGRGLITALGPGETTIIATVTSVSDSFQVFVQGNLNEPSEIIISKSSPKPALLEGESLAINAEILNSARNPVPGIVLNWQSSDTTVLKVDGNGIVTAQAVGQATVNAMYNDISSNDLLISVLADSTQIAQIQISARADRIDLGDTLQFSAVAFNGQGQEISDLVFEWESSDPSILGIDANGLASALSEGTAQIRAVVDGFKSPEFSVEIINVNRVQDLSISAPANSLLIGEMLQFSATARNGNGETINSDNITWQSSNSNLFSIDENGLGTALGEGTVQVRAMADGVSSNSLSVAISAPNPTASARSGNFMDLNGYSARGVATLEEENGRLVLNFASDFRISNGPGLYVYLSSDDRDVSGGVELGRLTSNQGAQSYQVPEDVSIDQFDYVVVFCVPFRASFGAARLEE